MRGDRELRRNSTVDEGLRTLGHLMLLADLANCATGWSRPNTSEVESNRGRSARISTGGLRSGWPKSLQTRLAEVMREDFQAKALEVPALGCVERLQQ
jgi:hypothetical protein